MVKGDRLITKPHYKKQSLSLEKAKEINNATKQKVNEMFTDFDSEQREGTEPASGSFSVQHTAHSLPHSFP